MLGIRPVTPGTVVVLAGTILLVLVSVSVPILKSVYFLEASVSATVDSTTYASGAIRLGVWGYCVGSTCSNTTLGYTLNNIDELLGISQEGIGALISEKIPTTLVKWLTYVLVLHPIAAGFGVIATICGLLAHIREFAITGFTTCFAGFGAFFALVAFIFDMILFYLAKKRIVAAGGSATLGNALWMTLAGMLCLMFSGCFFGLGRCLIRKRRPEREASEKNKPSVDPNYSNSMRQDAVGGGGGYGQGGMYGGNSSGFNSTSKNSYAARNSHQNRNASNNGGSLPEFQEYNGEIIPLTSVRHDEDLDDEPVPRQQYRDTDRTEAASLVTGVGMGYGRRTDQGQPISMASQSTYHDPYALPPPPRRTQTGSSSTVTPFTGMGMHQPEPDQHHYVPSTSPPAALLAGAGGYRSPSHSPPPPANPYNNNQSSYPSEKGAGAYQGAYNTPPQQYAPQRQASSSSGFPVPNSSSYPQLSTSPPPPPASSSSYYALPPPAPGSVAPTYTSHPPQGASSETFGQPGGGLYAGGQHDPMRNSVSSYGADDYAASPPPPPQDHLQYQAHQQQDPYTYNQQQQPPSGGLHNPYAG
ncbi:hypothetical protein RQP46_003001 [Phenoliferia psychrophenolica]